MFKQQQKVRNQRTFKDNRHCSLTQFIKWLRTNCTQINDANQLFVSRRITFDNYRILCVFYRFLLIAHAYQPISFDWRKFWHSTVYNVKLLTHFTNSSTNMRIQLHTFQYHQVFRTLNPSIDISAGNAKCIYGSEEKIYYKHTDQHQPFELNDYMLIIIY